MEVLNVLERRVTELLLLVTHLKNENGKLMQENTELRKMLEKSEQFVTEKSTAYNQEVTAAQVIVDSLIKDIDAVVGQEHV